MSGEAPLRKQESSASLLHGDRSLVLGIDIGTTSVKVCIMDAATQKCVKQLNKDTQANVPSELGSEGNKQYVPKIISALHGCISRLPRDALRRVEKVGICGQMHGCVLWKSGRAWSRKPDTNTYDIDEVSHLYTWQDTRCTPEFLSSLPAPDSHLSVHSGYGVATLLWFLRHKPQKLELYDRSGTIQDLVVAMLCDLDVPVMSVQNAASWGYFNTQTGTWNADILHGAGLPSTLLPSVVRSGQPAGRLHSSWLGLPAGTPVIAALGDLQCSVLPLLTSGSTAALNVSTSAQLALALPDGFHPPASADGCISYLPFLDGRYLAVAAALTGGNAMAAFVQMLQRWTQELGRNMPQSDVWTKILSLADTDDSAGTSGGSVSAGVISSGSGINVNTGSGSGSGTVNAGLPGNIINTGLSGSSGSAELCIVPTVRGERHAPHQRATVTGVTVDNTGLGHVTNAICRGIAENLDSMMSREWLAAHGVTRLVGTGSALARNAALRRAFQRTYQVPLDMADETSAAYGAALAAARYL